MLRIFLVKPCLGATCTRSVLFPVPRWALERGIILLNPMPWRWIVFFHAMRGV
jgi:hypothetical protein